MKFAFCFVFVYSKAEDNSDVLRKRWKIVIWQNNYSFDHTNEYLMTHINRQKNIIIMATSRLLSRDILSLYHPRQCYTAEETDNWEEK